MKEVLFTMKKLLSRTLAFTLVALMGLTACTGGGTNPVTESPAVESQDPAASQTPAEPPANPLEDAEAEAPVENTGEPIADMVYPRLAQRELETFMILHSQRAEDSENLTQLFDPLLELDNKGALVPALAEEWGTEDGGLTWTFKLRDGLQWVDVQGNPKAPINAHDFASGLEWVLNFHKNDSLNTSMPLEMITGANEYYEWTKSLTKEEADVLTAEDGSRFKEMVGLETPDDLTVVYHCIVEKPYFDTVATYTCLYPVSQAMVDELGGVEAAKAMNNENMWYSGAYTMTSYIQGNEKIFTPNPLYWDTNCTRFNSVTVRMIDSFDVEYQLYQTGEVDYVQLSESNLRTIADDPNHEFHDYLVLDVPSKYSYQFHFNYNKLLEDGTPDTNWNTAIANKNFRLAWMHGLELTEYYKRTNAIDPYACENNFYTMKGLVYKSDGTEYTDLVRGYMGLKDSDGTAMARFDAAKAADYKAKAMEELSALGVTFPVQVDYYIMAANQTALDTATVLKQCFTNSLGDDFMVLNIKTFVASNTTEVIDPQLHSIAINGWGADYGDPQNYLGQEIYGNDNAYYSANYSNINQVTEETDANADLLAAYREFTDMVAAADAITEDMDARYEAYAEAEAFMLNNALAVPSHYQVMWALSKIDNASRINGVYGIQNEKFKNWNSSVDGYTTAQSTALLAERDAQ
jgi:oligopeptide transport system substrate-binding protein